MCMYIANIYAYRYAIIIGHNDGGKDVEKLRYAESDAKRFAALLTSHGGFNTSKVMVLLHPQKSDIDNSFKKMSNISLRPYA